MPIWVLLGQNLKKLSVQKSFRPKFEKALQFIKFLKAFAEGPGSAFFKGLGLGSTL